jgi:Lar family restriction alleviation protein
MDEYEELKPCPFCGSFEVNNTEPPSPDKHGAYCWVCPDCIACGGVGLSIKDATDAWNVRLINLDEL